MKNIKKLIAVMVIAVLAAGCLSACGGGGSGSSDTKQNTLKIAYQYGLAYAPLEIMKEQKLIEKYYDGAEVEWVTLNSGSAINEGFASGDVDAGAMGAAPAVTGATSGVPYKICANMSAQPQALMTMDNSIKSLKDIGKKKIALVNIGSIQHILLAMAAKEQLGDAHALDNNIAAMAHPDGMSALLSKSVDAQVTTSPYIYKEVEKGAKRLNIFDKVWPDGNSFIVAVASTKLQKENPELYDAYVKAMAEAIDYINNNKAEAAKLLCKSEDVDAATMEKWLNEKGCVYSTETKGMMKLAKFMAENDFLENDGPSQLSDLAFDNVKGN